MGGEQGHCPGPCPIICDYRGLGFSIWLDPGPVEQRSGISGCAKREQSQRVPAVSKHNFVTLTECIKVNEKAV